MSVLTHVIKRRQQWHHLCEAASRGKRVNSAFDRIFYAASAVLIFVYRVELLGMLTRYLESL